MPRYIDADAFEVDCRKRYCTGCENYNGIKCKSCWVADMLDETENAPTVSPDEVRGAGEWKKTDAFPHRVYCSNCFKTIVPNEEFAFWCEGIMPRNYCPNCGAKMEVSEDA